MRIAAVCSAHGFGHLTRQLALAARWQAAGAEVTFFSAAPRAILDESLPGARLRPWTVDVGIRQHDSLTEDLPETLRLLGALLSGDWDVVHATDPRHRREASGLVAAYVAWHLERGLRSLEYVER